jgi:predicted amidophosphoribosyltransferase
MSFFEDMFEGFQRRGHGHGRNHGHGHHDHDDDYEDRDHHHGPAGRGYGAPPFTAPPSIACPTCNVVVPLTPGTRFCAGCGGPLAAEPTCKSCGNRLTAGATFCQGCGARVS